MNYLFKLWFKYTWSTIQIYLGHSMSTEPKPSLWPLQIFMKFLPFNFIIEVQKTWKFQHSSSSIWVLKVLHNFTLCPILKAIEIVKSPIKDPEKWKNQKMFFFYFLSSKHSWIEWLGDDWQKVSKIRSQLHTYSLSTFQWRFKNLQTSSCCKLFSNLSFSVAWKSMWENYQKSQIFILLVNFQDIENEDCVISFQALKTATKIFKNQQNRQFLGIFS